MINRIYSAQFNSNNSISDLFLLQKQDSEKFHILIESSEKEEHGLTQQQYIVPNSREKQFINSII